MNKPLKDLTSDSNDPLKHFSDIDFITPQFIHNLATHEAEKSGALGLVSTERLSWLRATAVDAILQDMGKVVDQVSSAESLHKKIRLLKAKAESHVKNGKRAKKAETVKKHLEAAKSYYEEAESVLRQIQAIEGDMVNGV